MGKGKSLQQIVKKKKKKSGNSHAKEWDCIGKMVTWLKATTNEPHPHLNPNDSLHRTREDNPKSHMKTRKAWAKTTLNISHARSQSVFQSHGNKSSMLLTRKQTLEY